MFPLQFATHTLKLKKQKINTTFLVKKTRTNLPHFVFLSVIVPCAAHSNTPTCASRNMPLTHARTYRSDMEGNSATIFIFSHICKNKVRFWETLTHRFSLPFEMTHRNNLFDNFRESSRSQFRLKHLCHNGIRYPAFDWPIHPPGSPWGGRKRESLDISFAEMTQEATFPHLQYVVIMDVATALSRASITGHSLYCSQKKPFKPSLNNSVFICVATATLTPRSFIVRAKDSTDVKVLNLLSQSQKLWAECLWCDVVFWVKSRQQPKQSFKKTSHSCLKGKEGNLSF